MNNSLPNTWAVVRSNWLNFRKRRFWGIAFLLLYTLVGFFLVPVVVKNTAVSFLYDEFKRTAKIERVEFNPYFLRLRIHGFEFLDTDEVTLASFDSLSINFQLSSLFRWAWTFQEIKIENPYFLFERFDGNTSRLSLLLANDTINTGSEPTETEVSTSIPRFLISEFSIDNGSFLVQDNLPDTPVNFTITPINFFVQDLNSLPDMAGRQKVEMNLPQGGSLEWTGSLELAPLVSSGEVSVITAIPKFIISYLEALLPLEQISADLSSNFQYNLSQDDQGDINLNVEQLDLELSDLRVQGLSPKTEFLKVQRLSLTGGSIHLAEQTAYFERVQIDAPIIDLWLDETGSLSLEQLTPPSTESEQSLDASGPGWDFALNELVITKGEINFTDYGNQAHASLGLSSLEIVLQEITNEDNARFPLSLSAILEGSGRIEVDSILGILPDPFFTGSTKLTEIPLSLAEPYIQEALNVSVPGGVLNSEIQWTINGHESSLATGAVTIPGLDVRDGIANKKLVTWGKFNIDRFEMDFNNKKLHLSKLQFTDPYARVVINADQTTNISELLVDTTADKQVETEHESDTAFSMDVVVGGIQVDSGSLDMSDFSLPLPFLTHITGLKGNVSTVSTLSEEPARLKLEGAIDEYGLALIEGSMTVFDPTLDTEISLQFRNLKMSNLSPYTAEFAGRKIDAGNLGLTLSYQVNDGILIGSNDIVLSDIVLGERVDHPDATHLPLGIAIALLTDSDGVIDIDLPVSGDINDPEFEIGGIIWKAFTQLLTKLITSPFRFLGGLVGIDSDDLGEFEYLPGRSDLTPPELEKVKQLTLALQKRPELIIEIAGVYDPDIDVPALKFSNLKLRVLEILNEESGSRGADMMLDEDLQVILESLLLELQPDLALQVLRERHTSTPSSTAKGDPIFDSLSYSAELRDQLLDLEKVSEEDLSQLANDRASALQGAFMANESVDETRIKLLNGKQVDSESAQWVKLVLSIASEAGS